MPKSIEKDYYIWRFLQQPSTTKKEAIKIMRGASAVNKRLKRAYRKKTGKTAPYIAPPPPKHDWKKRSKAHTYFRYGLRFLREGKSHRAHVQFYGAYQHYEKQYDKDKSLFWIYLSKKDKKYLKQLLKSTHINLYTLIAADILQTTYPKTTEADVSSSRSGYDPTDPIAWAKIKRKMEHTQNLDDLAEKYDYEESIGVYIYLKAKASNYTKAYFPMPYKNAFRGMSKERRALIYALARQESYFVPASVSRSFAIGMLQFMPFLVKHVAKERGEKIDLDDMFDPYRAISYADHHLNYLTTYLYHPLFIAYAYNGGIGFTRRHIKNRKHFREGNYEPYMSMESMENAEAREYGKKVLANYVIYMNQLGTPRRLLPLLQTLTNPRKTDRFRRY
jgi:soluble lytic murein transglycosylase